MSEYGERWAPNRHCWWRLARHDWMQNRCIDCRQRRRRPILATLRGIALGLTSHPRAPR